MLVVTRCRSFEAAVPKLFCDQGLKLHCLALETVEDIGGVARLKPDVAFVDYGAAAAHKVPLYRALSKAVPDCQVILLCARGEAGAAAEVVRVREAFDYLLTDCELDSSRIRMLLERAVADRLSTLFETGEAAKQQHRRILELLRELREILKAETDSPVVKAIADYRQDTHIAENQGVHGESGLAGAYERCLVDVICGKLRRLEQEVRTMEAGEVRAECDTSGGILIVEDDAISAELARGILEGNGFDVVVAATVDAAKRALIRHRPAVVLMDVHLGAADGLQVVNLMRHSDDFRHVPVIVVTADNLRSTLSQAATLQIQGYLLKPFDPRELIGKVSKAIRSQLGGKIASPPSPASVEASARRDRR